MSTWAERFKTRRVELDLSQEKIAQRASLSRQTIADYELRGRLPEPMNVPVVARALSLDEEEVWAWIRDEVAARWERLTAPAPDVVEALEVPDVAHTPTDGRPSP